jgi:hypothetical protein
MGVPLRTLVDMRVRATGREFHSVWDEIVLEIMSVDPTYRRHLNVLIGTPEKSGQDAPILSRPARPTTRPWKAA